MRGFKGFKRLISIALVFAMILSVAACSKESGTDETVSVFNNGVSIGGIDISGLTEEEAAEKLAELADEDTVITLTYGDEQTYEIKFGDINVEADITSALTAALAKEADEETVDISISYSCDSDLLEECLISLNEQIEEEDGLTIDVEKTEEKIIKRLAAGNLNTISAVEIEDEEEEDEEMVLIGSFSTAFSASDTNRNENLRVACEKINGTILEPGDIFDMNEALGPQTAANGYKAAGTIENGKIVSAIAGGVCQVTTTIYNAAIFAELNIVERHNHSLMVSYVPLGRDAAVAGTYKNLRFENNTDYDIMIETYIEDYNVVCNIYGHEIHDEGRTIDFERVWVSTISKPAEIVTEDPDMYEDERVVTYTGKTGAKIDTYKLVYEDGELVSREWFSSSTYSATADEVTVGTKSRETVTEEVPVIGATDNITTTTPTEPSVSDTTAADSSQSTDTDTTDTSLAEESQTSTNTEENDYPTIGESYNTNISDIVIGA